MQRCRICSHPELSRIDQLIRSGTSTLSLHRSFGLSRPSIDRHRTAHVLAREPGPGKKAARSTKRGASLAIASRPSAEARHPDEVLAGSGGEATDTGPLESDFREPADILQELIGIMRESRNQLKTAEANPLAWNQVASGHVARLEKLGAQLAVTRERTREANLIRHPAWLRIRTRLVAILESDPEMVEKVTRTFTEELGMEYIE